MFPPFSLQRKGALVKFQSYSPFGLLVRSKFVGRLPLKSPFSCVDKTTNGLVGVSVQSGGIKNLIHYAFGGYGKG